MGAICGIILHPLLQLRFGGSWYPLQFFVKQNSWSILYVTPTFFWMVFLTHLKQRNRCSYEYLWAVITRVTCLLMKEHFPVHGDVITWKCDPHYWPFVKRIPQKRLWCVILKFPFVVSQNDLLNKQSSCRWFCTPWRSGDVTGISHNMDSCHKPIFILEINVAGSNVLLVYAPYFKYMPHGSITWLRICKDACMETKLSLFVEGLSVKWGCFIRNDAHKP